jgi:hypothetical protein
LVIPRLFSAWHQEPLVQEIPSAFHRCGARARRLRGGFAAAGNVDTSGFITKLAQINVYNRAGPSLECALALEDKAE